MKENNHKIIDYDAVLDAKFGEAGTPSRLEAEEKAFSFYTGQITKQTQTELAETNSWLPEMGSEFPHANDT
jgi:hypothetical protein